MPLEFPRTLTSSLAALSVAFTLVACASGPAAPTAQMANARTALTQAEAAGARDGAPLELAAAQAKFARAEGEMRAERFEVARRLSDEVLVDAELAERKARAAKANVAASELARSNQFLRQELDRKTTP